MFVVILIVTIFGICNADARGNWRPVQIRPDLEICKDERYIVPIIYCIDFSTEISPVHIRLEVPTQRTSLEDRTGIKKEERCTYGWIKCERIRWWKQYGMER